VIAKHLPVLLVVVPLISAPLCVLIRHRTAAWALAVTVSWAALAAAVALLLRVLNQGPFSYLLGNWAAPWGIEYRLDGVNAFVLVIVASIAAVVAPYARTSVEREVAGDRVYLFYAMYLLCLAGLLGIAITGDAFNLFVFLEIQSLSTYVLVSMSRDRRALVAAYRYLVMGTIGATFYIIGVGMMYMMTGTLNMADLAERLPAVAETTTVLVALAFLTVGIGLKMALFPLHLWLPNAYAYAPSAVTAFVAATGTKVSVYVFLRIFFTVFGPTHVLLLKPLADVLLVLAVVGMFVASAAAVFQNDVKRMLAYSSVAQVSYMVLGISLLNVTGVAAGVVHLFNHALMKCALFLALGAMVLRAGSVRLEALAGIGRRMPFTAAAFVVSGLSLIGVPLTVGFISKWYLVAAALEKGHWPVAFLIVLSSLLAIVYIWRVVEVAYFRPAPAGGATVAEAPIGMLVPLWVVTAAVIYFGIDANNTFGIARGAAAFLTGAAP
jgi:multicomponent Na+:H+ antiporter subunit D